MTTTENSPADASVDLRDPALYINRELSWLEFNYRVLALADNPRVPLLERCKFLAIFSSNLDEFFMVRVAVNQEALEQGRPPSTWDQLPRQEVLRDIATRVRELVDQQTEIWHGHVKPELARNGINIAGYADLAPPDRLAVDTTFDSVVYPVLTPLAVGPAQPFPYISGLSLNLGMMVRDPLEGEQRFARLKVPPRLPRLLAVGDFLVPIEEAIEAHLDRLFPGMDVADAAQFRLTRDADFEISDEAEDLLGALEDKLRARRFGHVVRLEVERNAPEELVGALAEQLDVDEADVYRIDRPLDMTGLWQLAKLDRPDLRYPRWTPRTQPRLAATIHRTEGDAGHEPDVTGADIFQVIRAGDVLVNHPYDDFDTSVARFVEQAVEDPSVLAIKWTMYRTSGDSRIVPGLIRAAEQGKQVVCMVEIKARFDEEANIRWGRALERAGVHVVYGQPGLKTHTKLALVVRREGAIVRRYAHIGTGNYNPTTAKLYTDLGMLTCRDDITQDVADLFNHLTGFSRPPAYSKLLVSPYRIRDGLVAEIDRTIASHEAGVPARIAFKCNAIIDGPMIEAIYRAARAGVRVDIVSRGIVGLRPGIPGISDNIRVISIVGRFLEHSRVYAFYTGEEASYYIGSADLMPRNLDHRVEAVTPVEDPLLKRELEGLLATELADTELAWELNSDGTWERVPEPVGGESVNSQETFMERAASRGLRG